VSSLNPTLEEARFCPRCGAPAEVRYPRSIHCAACGYAAFFNPKPVACAIARDGDGRIILARRAFDPGRGRWSMPGGFVDLGETVEDAVRRELREELALDIELDGLVGVYSSATERVVLIVYAATARGSAELSAEALEVRAFAPEELPWDELAFPTDEQALRDLLTRPTRSATPPG
jgi:ADP-ribose pyrophosphatase YjhB (NUDIX family)